MTGVRWSDDQLKAHIQRREGAPLPQGQKAKPKRVSPYRFASKLEARYAAHLDALKAAGEIVDWDYEPARLRIADGSRYTPDFMVVTADGIAFHETKGHWREASRVRIKAAAERYPWFGFIGVQQRAGEWCYEEFG